MTRTEVFFIPSGDVATVLHALLDKIERRETFALATGAAAGQSRSTRVSLSELSLPTYFSQSDPEPRQVANEQLQTLEDLGLLRLVWQPGEKGHLLEAAILLPDLHPQIYTLLNRVSTADRRASLEGQLLGERFRFGGDDWRNRAVHHILEQLKAGKSPAPFSLNDPVFNEDLLRAMTALPALTEETPYRVFSVRTFNDSKRFEYLENALLRLAKIGQPEWKRLQPDEVLRELNLVTNPGYLYLTGAWELVDANGQILSLGGFSPAVGVSAVQAAHLQRVSLQDRAVVCIENLTTFYEFIRTPGLQATPAICLMGNPSPACRHVLSHLDATLPEDALRYVWADLDYGGFNILAQLRRQVSARFMPYRMDIETLEKYADFARPLTANDHRNLTRLLHRPELQDLRPVINHLLRRGLKLEQEACSISDTL
jgi:hypothetical protein